MYKFDAKLTQFKVGREGVYRLISIFSPIALIFLWEALVRTGVLDYRFFPAPTTVLGIMFAMIKSGELLEHMAISLQRIIIGFIMGAAPGIILGMLMGWSKGARAFLDPIISALYPIPKVSLLPLILIIFGIGEMSKVVVVAIAGSFMVIITTAHGVMRIDQILIQAAQNYGARGWNLFSKVILPASLPAIFTGLRLSLGISLLIIVAAEFVAANKGLGYLIWISWSTLTVGKMYAGLVVLGVLGLIFTSGLERIGKILMPWAEDVQNRTR